MKRIINLIFDRIERVLWFRHLLWTLRKVDNDPFMYYFGSNKRDDDADEHLEPKIIDWLHRHRNDYLDSARGNTTGTENSTEVTEEKS